MKPAVVRYSLLAVAMLLLGFVLGRRERNEDINATNPAKASSTGTPGVSLRSRYRSGSRVQQLIDYCALENTTPLARIRTEQLISELTAKQARELISTLNEQQGRSNAARGVDYHETGTDERWDLATLVFCRLAELDGPGALDIMTGPSFAAFHDGVLELYNMDIAEVAIASWVDAQAEAAGALARRLIAGETPPLELWPANADDINACEALFGALAERAPGALEAEIAHLDNETRYAITSKMPEARFQGRWQEFIAMIPEDDWLSRRRIVRDWLKNEPDEAGNWVGTNATVFEEKRQFAEAFMTLNLNQGVEWFMIQSALTPGEQHSRAYSIAQRLVHRNLPMATEWASNLPPGKGKDAAAKRIAKYLANDYLKTPPKEIFHWVDQISHDSRSEVIEEIRDELERDYRGDAERLKLLDDEIEARGYVGEVNECAVPEIL